MTNRTAKATSDLLFYISGLVCLLLLIGLILQFYFTATLQVDMLNADAMLYPLLAKDIFQDPKMLRGWSLPPAPAYFPDTLLYFLFFAISSSARISSLLYGLSIIVIFILILSISTRILWPHSHSSTSKGTPTRITIILTAASILLLITMSPDSLGMLALIPGHHSGAGLCLLIQTGLLLAFLKSGKKSIAILYVLLAIISQASDPGYTVYWFVPYMAGLLISFYFLSRELRQRLIVIAVISIVSWFVGLRFESYLKSLNFALMAEYMPERIETIWQGMISFYIYIPVVLSTLFMETALIEKILFIPAYFWIFWKQLHAFQNRKWAEQIVADNYLVLLRNIALLSPIIMIATLAYLLAMEKTIAARYFIPAYLLILGTLTIDIYQTNLRSSAVFTGLLLIFCFACVHFIRLPWQATVYQLPAVACLDLYAGELPTKYGMANYWDAKPGTALNKSGLLINQVTDKFTPVYWINNYYWYFGKDKSPEYSFVIVDRLDSAITLQKFGEPTKRLNCPQTSIWIYSGPGSEKFRDQLRFTKEEIKLWKLMTGR